MFQRMPFIDPLATLGGDLDRMFAAALRGWARPDLRDRGSFPALRASDTGDAIVLEAELPGVRSDQLDVRIRGRELTLEGRRDADRTEGVTVRRRERGSGDFTRVVRLPFDVQSDRVSASLEHGVLTVRLPKVESERPRSIPVVQERSES